MVGPDNGSTYTAIELEAIWELVIEPADVLRAFEPAFQFHRHAAVLLNNPMKDDDRWAENLIVRACLAETDNPAQTPPPPWPCVAHHDDGTPRSEEDAA